MYKRREISNQSIGKKWTIQLTMLRQLTITRKKGKLDFWGREGFLPQD